MTAEPRDSSQILPNQLICRPGPQPLCIDVDHERGEQNEAADQYFQETVNIDVIEPVVEHAQHEQADNRVADAAAAPEQAGATDHDGGDRIEQVGVEFVLLRAAKMGDAQHSADSRADRRNDHDAAENQFDIEPRIFRRFAVSADHVDVAAEARVGQHQMAAEQHQGGDNDDPGDAADRGGAEARDQIRHFVGDLAADE